MPNAVRNTEPPVPAVAIAARILTALSNGGHDSTLTELARVLELPKSTLHNQLATLEAYRLVYRDDTSRRYRLGAGLISLGLAAGRQLRSAALVAQRLPALAAAHGLTFAVAQVADPLEAVLVDCAYPVEDMHVGLSLGARYGVFHGAAGKCLLAALGPDEAARALLDREIPRYTSHTIVDPVELLEDIDRARTRGWAASAGEFKENHAVAVPSFGPAGGLELIVFAVGFPAQLPVDRFEEVAGVLADTVRDVNHQEDR
jgi:IclR family acetate operon transcriptional repressor